MKEQVAQTITQLAKAEEKSGQKLAELKKEINTLKENYLKEMEQITKLSQAEKVQAEKKVLDC